MDRFGKPAIRLRSEKARYRAFFPKKQLVNRWIGHDRGVDGPTRIRHSLLTNGKGGDLKLHAYDIHLRVRSERQGTHLLGPRTPRVRAPVFRARVRGGLGWGGRNRSGATTAEPGEDGDARPVESSHSHTRPSPRSPRSPPSGAAQRWCPPPICREVPARPERRR